MPYWPGSRVNEWLPETTGGVPSWRARNSLGIGTASQRRREHRLPEFRVAIRVARLVLVVPSARHDRQIRKMDNPRTAANLNAEQPANPRSYRHPEAPKAESTPCDTASLSALPLPCAGACRLFKVGPSRHETTKSIQVTHFRAESWAVELKHHGRSVDNGSGFGFSS